MAPNSSLLAGSQKDGSSDGSVELMVIVERVVSITDTAAFAGSF
jgi:hypothetical protein